MKAVYLSWLHMHQRALLAETSCYVYWNNDFWFDQGKRMVEFAYQQMEEGS
jgi:hypothetical protein